MKKISIVLLCAFSAFLTMVVATNANAADWRFSEARYIDCIWAQTSGFMFILEGEIIDVNSMPENPDCHNRFSIQQSSAYEAEMIQTVFAAYLLGSQILVKYDHESTLCNTPTIHVKAFNVP